MNTITVSADAARISAVRNAIVFVQAIDYTIDLLKQGEVARAKLDVILQNKFGDYAPCAKTIFDWLRTQGMVKYEVRAEEWMEKTENSSVVTDAFEMDENGTITIHNYDQKANIYTNGEILERNKFITYFRGTRRFQVRRKYYSWVG